MADQELRVRQVELLGFRAERDWLGVPTLRRLAVEKGYVPLGTMHFTVAMLVVAGMVLFGLLAAIPLWLLAWWRKPK